MKKIAFQTLGCKLNQFETDALAAQFQQGGYEVIDLEAESHARADAYVINTCTVTNKAGRKSRNIVNKAARLGPLGVDGLPAAPPVVVVTGCYAESDRESLEKSEDVTYVVDNSRKTAIFQLVEAHFKGEILHPEQLPADLFGFGAHDSPFHTRGTIKIQDGCDNFCTFCIIPFVRGGAVSRAPEAILDNVRALVVQGIKEIVITGINISRYKSGETTFEDLLGLILEVEGDFRVRISSLEPECLGEKFLALVGHPKLCPHLHLCLQSASPKILLAMRREYTLEDFAGLLARIRAKVPDFTITTDLIVGFPGETEEDFLASVESLARFGFAHVHVFKFSARQGTRAERMTGKVPEAEKTRRSNLLQLAMEQQKRAERLKWLGKTQRVLIEKTGPDGWAYGWGENYVPVRIQDSSIAWNTFVHARLDQLEDGSDPVVIGTRLP